MACQIRLYNLHGLNWAAPSHKGASNMGLPLPSDPILDILAGHNESKGNIWRSLRAIWEGHTAPHGPLLDHPGSIWVIDDSVTRKIPSG